MAIKTFDYIINFRDINLESVGDVSIDDWCEKNIGKVGDEWLPYDILNWQFRTEEGYVLFELAWL